MHLQLWASRNVVLKTQINNMIDKIIESDNHKYVVRQRTAQIHACDMWLLQQLCIYERQTCLSRDDGVATGV